MAGRASKRTSSDTAPAPVVTAAFDGGAVALHRRLTPRQRETQRALVDAAVQIATTEGYDALTTRAVASRAGVALGTVYRYTTSKDHLLALAMLDWSERFVASVVADPPAGATAAARVVEVFTRFARRSGRRPRLMEALFRAGMSNDPTVVAMRADQRSVTSRLVDLAIGPSEVADREDVLRVFEDVTTAALGSPTVDDRAAALVEHVDRAARLLLRDVP